MASGVVALIGFGNSSPLSDRNPGEGLRHYPVARPAHDAKNAANACGDVRFLAQGSRHRPRTLLVFVYNALGVPIAAGVLYPAFGILLAKSHQEMAKSVAGAGE